MRRLFLLLLNCIFCFVSCSYIKQGIDIEIINSSDEIVRDVVFLADGDAKIMWEQIEPNQKIKGFLDMTHTLGVDGSYTFVYLDKEGNKKQTASGYYTNGKPLNKKVVCEIQNDTIILNFQ
jgi:hypothetical protein